MVQGHCSAVKRLLEQDVPASRMMVLRVCSILPPASAAGMTSMHRVCRCDFSTRKAQMKAYTAHKSGPSGSLSIQNDSNWLMPSLRVARPCLLLRQGSVCAGQHGAGSTATATTLPTLILLTDGWYSVRAALDAPLAHQVALCRLRRGTKLRIMGAELLAAGNVAALEASRTAALKLHSNGTHRSVTSLLVAKYPDD